MWRIVSKGGPGLRSFLGDSWKNWSGVGTGFFWTCFVFVSPIVEFRYRDPTDIMRTFLDGLFWVPTVVFYDRQSRLYTSFSRTDDRGFPPILGQPFGPTQSVPSCEESVKNIKKMKRLRELGTSTEKDKGVRWKSYVSIETLLF